MPPLHILIVAPYPTLQYGLRAAVESVLGAAWTRLGELDQAEEALTRSYAALERDRGRESSEAQAALRRLVRLYELRGRPEAERFRAFLTPHPSEP